jgi:hypothetical protein
MAESPEGRAAGSGEFASDFAFQALRKKSLGPGFRRDDE